MAPSNQNLPDLSSADESAYLLVDAQHITIQRAWAVFGCAAPFLLFWLGVLLVGALTGW